MFGLIVYTLVAAGKLQPWAQYEDSDEVLAQNNVHKVEQGCETPIVPRSLCN